MEEWKQRRKNERVYINIVNVSEQRVREREQKYEE